MAVCRGRIELALNYGCWWHRKRVMVDSAQPIIGSLGQYCCSYQHSKGSSWKSTDVMGFEWVFQPYFVIWTMGRGFVDLGSTVRIDIQFNYLRPVLTLLAKANALKLLKCTDIDWCNEGSWDIAGQDFQMEMVFGGISLVTPSPLAIAVLGLTRWPQLDNSTSSNCLIITALVRSLP